MFIKKIFDKTSDEEVHLDLIKYSKGVFNKKYLIEAKNKKGFFNIKTGPEYANYFVKKGLESAKGKVYIKGIIVSTLDLEIPFSKDKKQFMGIKKYEVNGNFNSEEILDFIDKNPKLFYALSLSLPGYELKIKPKLPKSPKPSNTGEDTDDKSPDFCFLKTSSKDIIDELFFDVGEKFNEISIEHSLKINEIIYPEGFQKMKPEEIREKSKRKGKLIRKISIDGKEKINEEEFVA